MVAVVVVGLLVGVGGGVVVVVGVGGRQTFAVGGAVLAVVVGGGIDGGDVDHVAACSAHSLGGDFDALPAII